MMSAIVIDNSVEDDFAGVDVPEGYPGRVTARSDLRRPAEMAGAPERSAGGVVVQAMPSWIRAQVEQLEMRRKARHLPEKPRLAKMQESD